MSIGFLKKICKYYFFLMGGVFMINNQDYIYETQYLNKVYNLILREISSRNENSEANQSQIVTMRKSFWDSIVNSNEEIENVI
jgi:hypothetical protein